jgi:hypothetical protein
VEPKNPKKILDEIWPRVRRKHFYPEIPVPVIGPVTDSQGDAADRDPVGLNIQRKQMTINPGFLSEIKDRIPEEDALEALLDHGIAHYTFCPWDFHTYLTLYSEAKKVMGDKELAKQVANYFIDVVSETHCVKEKATKIPELHRQLEKGKIGNTISSLYEKIWGVNLGTSLSRPEGEEHGDIVRRLARIPYLDRGRWPDSIKRFARSIKPLFFEEESDQDKSTGNGKSESNPMGDHDLQNYSFDEIDEGLRQYAKASMTLPEFKEVVEDFNEEFKEAGFGTEAGMGRGRGALIDADVLFYMKLAENYSLPLKKVPLEKKGSLHPHSHAPWELGTPIQDVDIWTSFGKIMPGITQVWRKKEGKGRGKVDAAPECLIAVDSSGSMINPRKSLSYAVLGAACAADAYLRNDARVAVYNFSDAPMGGKDILNYTRRREDIYRVLCKYFGGGTALDLDDLTPLIQGRRDLDLFVITDMKITNLEALISFFGAIQNRVTAVHIGDNPYASRFEKAVERRSNINIYTVKRKEDIPHIVLGSIREYFSQTGKRNS